MFGWLIIYLTFSTAAIPAGAASKNPPTTYNAITDRIARPLPPLPVMGPANTSITDPNFGTQILRVTDASSIAASPNGPYRTPSGSFQNNWNADSTKFWFEDNGGSRYVVKFDSTTFTASLMMNPSSPTKPLVIPMGAAWFSYQDPNLVYGVTKHVLQVYNFATNTTTNLLDMTKIVPAAGAPGMFDGMMTVDDSGRYMAVTFDGPQQNEFAEILVYDQQLNQYALIDSSNSWVSPWAPITQPPNPKPIVDNTGTTLTLGFGLHSSYMVEDAGYKVYHFTEADGARDWIKKDHPVDIVIADIKLPGLSGIGLCSLLREDPQTSSLPILMLSVLGSEGHKVEGLHKGADDYLTKPFSRKELVARVASLLRRSKFQGKPKRILQSGEIEVDIDSAIVKVKGKAVEMQSKEYDLLVMFLEKPGRVLSKRFIAEAVWGYDEPVSAATLKVWISNLRKKLGVLGRKIETITNQGYKFS